MTIKIKKLQTTWIMLVEEFQKVYTIELKFSFIFVLNFQIFKKFQKKFKYKI